MSILSQLEHDLDDAARRVDAEQRAAVDAGTPVDRRRDGRRGLSLIGRELRHARLLLLSLAGLSATAAIALAATGVIPIATPIHSRASSPTAGVGIPAKGGARLLGVRAADPLGGLPWGLRLVRTTRGELCIQLGRVEDGKLGQLGIDGAFNDDGSFHPLTSADLPSRGLGGRGSAESEDTICDLAGGTAVEADATAERRNATGQWRGRPRTPPPLHELRDVYYGLLGAKAVSITYQDGSSTRTVAVERGTGAYIIVMPARRGLLLHSGWGTTHDSSGEISPSSDRGVIEAVTYEVDGKLCQRGARSNRGKEGAVAHRCPIPRSSPPPRPAPPRELHRPVNVRLHLRGHVVIGATVSFTAPFTVTSARDEYEIAIQDCGTTAVSINNIRAISPIDRDVARGQRISHPWSHPFVACNAKSITFDVLYEHTTPGPIKPMILGSITVARPPHTHAARHRPR